MSESEKKKRLEYRKRRKRWITFQVIIAVLLIVAFIPFTIISRNDARDVEVSYTETGSVDYKVYLKENNFYEEEFLGKDKEYIATLIDNIVVDFDYNYALNKQSVADSGVDLSAQMYWVTYEIYGELLITKKSTGNTIYAPSYTFVEEYTKHFSIESKASIENSVIIDYAEYNSRAKEFIKAYNLENQGVESFLKLYMSAKVGGVGEQVTSHAETLSIPLTEETIDITFTSSVPTNGNKIMVCVGGDGQPYGYLALLSVGVGIIVLLIMGIYAVLTRNYDIEYDIKVKRLVSQYKSYVQKIINEFCTNGYQVLKVSTFKEMLDIRDTTQLPILMHENQDRTMTKFLIPTESNLLYVYEIKVEDYDEIYGATGNALAEVATAQAVTEEQKVNEQVVQEITEKVNEQAEVSADSDFRSNISYDYSFISKLHLSSKETRAYYKEIISFIKSYGVNVTRTWDKEKICVGRNVLAVISFKGMKLSIAYKLDVNEYAESKYKLVDMSAIKRFEKTPAFMKVTSDRKVKWAIELLNIVFSKEGLENKNLPTKEKNIPAKTREALIKDNLIRVKEKKSR